MAGREGARAAGHSLIRPFQRCSSSRPRAGPYCWRLLCGACMGQLTGGGRLLPVVANPGDRRRQAAPALTHRSGIRPRERRGRPWAERSRRGWPAGSTCASSLACVLRVAGYSHPYRGTAGRRGMVAQSGRESALRDRLHHVALHRELGVRAGRPAGCRQARNRRRLADCRRCGSRRPDACPSLPGAKHVAESPMSSTGGTPLASTWNT